MVIWLISWVIPVSDCIVLFKVIVWTFRIEDKSKALSYIGIEIADALKTIPTPIDDVEQQKVEEPQKIEEEQQYIQEMTFEQKPSLWERIKNCKLVRTIKYIAKIRVVLDYSALPVGRGENN